MNGMQDHGVGTLSNGANGMFCNSILMMCPNTREFDGLIMNFKIVKKFVRPEDSIISMVGLNFNSTVQGLPLY